MTTSSTRRSRLLRIFQPAASGRAEPDVTIIEPPGRRPALRFGELWRNRSVALVLTRRNLMVRYRQSVVGIGWVLLQPLALMLVFTIFFGLTMRFPDMAVPFPVFYLCALWMWMPMTKVVTEGAGSILSNLQLVTRVYVPRALIPLSVALSTFVDLFFLFVAFEVCLLLYGILPTERIVVTPALIVIGYATTLGLGYLMAALNTRYRDVQLALPFLLQMWFFVTPIIYPVDWIPPSWQPLYYLNPMALVVTGSRWVFAGLEPPPDYAWLLAGAVALLCLVVGYVFFRSREPTFADYA